MFAATLAAGGTFAQTAPSVGTGATASRPASVIVFDGVVDDYSRDMLFKRWAQAKAGGAGTIILELTTPGGLVTSGLDISRFLRGQTDVHTIAFVQGRALSAGIMIGLACDELVMAPQSLIGDSAPISMSSDGGLRTLGETERAKAESPILADFYASAVRNGYDPLLTSAMVTMGRTVHAVTDSSGTRKFVEPADYEKLTKSGWTPVAGLPDPVDRSDTLLTVDSILAEKIGLSKGTFTSPAALASARGLTISATYAPSIGDRLVELLASGVTRSILIVVLMQALYLAFGHPGHGWPEAIALIALGLLLGVPLLTGYANWLEVLAIVLGLVLLAAEIFVIPGFGLAGISGLVLLFGGLVLTFVGGEPSIPGILPSLRGTWSALQNGLMFVTVGLACSLALWLWLNRFLPKLPYFNRIILKSTAGDVSLADFDRPVETGPAVGDIGIALTNLVPGGSVKFTTESYPNGRVAAVVSDNGYVPAGTQVVVQEVAGNRVVVRGPA
jgi:membrane-bound serine protease (ClpP class)